MGDNRANKVSLSATLGVSTVKNQTICLELDGHCYNNALKQPRSTDGEEQNEKNICVRLKANNNLR